MLQILLLHLWFQSSLVLALLLYEFVGFETVSCYVKIETLENSNMFDCFTCVTYRIGVVEGEQEQV
ncbi:unnamed protein product [Arabidopsis halleri]